MIGGFFAVDRGIWHHHLLDKGEPFSGREAWLWLISEAAWKPRARAIGARTVEIRRGQLAHSLRFMAGIWRWPEPRVRRFLGRLKNDAMIDAATDAGMTVITICNYNKYQRASLPSDAPIDAPIDAETTRTRISKEKKDAALAAPEPSSDEIDLFRRGKAVLGKDSGGLIKKLLTAKGSVALARAVIETASTKENPREWIGGVLRGSGDTGRPQGAII